MVQSGRKFGENILNLGENSPFEQQLRFATDKKEKNSILASNQGHFRLVEDSVQDC